MVRDAAAEHLADFLLVRNGIRRLAHELLDVIDAAHLGVDLPEHARALLQAEDDVLLYEGELDVAGELLELGQLGVRLGEQLLLVLLPPQREEGALLVAGREHLARDVRLLVRQDDDAALVLVELVALELQVEDGLVLGRYTAVAIPHLVLSFLDSLLASLYI